MDGSGLHIASNLSVLAGALLVEALVGYPKGLFRGIGHPVTWMGSLLEWLDARLNQDGASQPARYAAGVLALTVVLALAVLPTTALQIVAMSAPRPIGWLVITLLVSTLLAQRSLATHVQAVADTLERNGLEAGRQAVSHIVGRNPQALDEAGVVRAAIESLAENFSDAVVAPAFWCVMFGLPGIAAYKAINTADSMIGHRTRRHIAFGWAAARLDDVVNLPGSRLASLWLTLAALFYRRGRAGAGFRAVWRDARKHRSPNAGWPEAAMAGALGLRLAGPRVYGTTRVDDAWMGNGRDNATVADLRHAVALYCRACALQIVAVLMLATTEHVLG
ncbi:MAG: cobalamin biosynthesis protein CobD [Acetobacteraceae bacterium]|nr:cobalamin biosynthesis protein CobD [Acetobacteraceae bacterium]